MSTSRDETHAFPTTGAACGVYSAATDLQAFGGLITVIAVRKAEVFQLFLEETVKATLIARAVDPSLSAAELGTTCAPALGILFRTL